MTDSGFYHGIKHFIAGSASGVALVLAGHPFDTIKVRLQTDASNFYKGPLDCVKQTLHKEGLRGFYKGVTPPLLMTGCINSALFGMMGLCRDIRRRRHAKSGGESVIRGELACGLQTGVVLAFMVTPMEHVKTKLQVQRNAAVSLYQGPVDCARQLVRTGGLRSLWLGLGPTCLHRGSNWAYFGSYSLSVAWLTDRRQTAKQNHARALSESDAQNPQPPPLDDRRPDVHPMDAVVSGMVAGTCFWSVCYPIDVIKGRMQAQPYTRPLAYPTMLAVARDIVQKNGWRAFFRGFTPCILRSMPANASAFLAFETTMRLLP